MASGVPAGIGQGLCGHKVSGGIAGIIFKKPGELGQRSLGVAAACQFHGQAVAGKTVFWVHGENLGQSLNLVHLPHL